MVAPKCCAIFPTTVGHSRRMVGGVRVLGMQPPDVHSRSDKQRWAPETRQSLVGTVHREVVLPHHAPAAMIWMFSGVSAY